MESSDTEERELTVDEAVLVAISLQKQQQFAHAGALYSRVLEVAPDHPDALHFSGVLAHQEGRTDDAVALIKRSLAVSPNHADAHSNLGIVFGSVGRVDEAIAAYQRAIAIDPRHGNAHNNLGAVLRAAGRPEEAEVAYRTAISLDPGHVDAYTNLGILLNGLNRTVEASACFSKVITLQPKHREGRRLLALAHCVLGEVDRAVEILTEWLEEEPGNPIAVHMLAAATGRNVPLRASNAFVKNTFDSFAESFEARLESLSYRAPKLIAAALGDAGLRADQRLDVLDAGCGTGLCGPLLAPYASRLVGVDLSGGMLEHARSKNVYSELEQCELTAYLRARPEEFDVVVAADTLVYFGDLREFSEAAARALRPSGVLAFTLEHAVDAADGYRLELHGRYSHDRRYAEQTLLAAGLRPQSSCAELRMESGSPVAGLVMRGFKDRSA
ncbi:MAG: tetratricopeptide repeat protein [Mycobacterium sp.]